MYRKKPKWIRKLERTERKLYIKEDHTDRLKSPEQAWQSAELAHSIWVKKLNENNREDADIMAFLSDTMADLYGYAFFRMLEDPDHTGEEDIL